MMNPWHGKGDFLAALSFWTEVQGQMRSDSATRSDPRTIGRPYLEGARMVIPDWHDANSAEIYTDYSICHEGEYFVLRKSGRGDRGRTFNDLPAAWFGTFDDAAKYLVGAIIAAFTRLKLNPHPEPVGLRWANAGLPANWSSSQELDPSGITPAKRYFRTDDLRRFYFTDASDEATAWLLDLSWNEITATYSNGIPSAARVTPPVFDSPDPAIVIESCEAKE